MSVVIGDLRSAPPVIQGGNAPVSPDVPAGALKEAATDKATVAGPKVAASREVGPGRERRVSKIGTAHDETIPIGEIACAVSSAVVVKDISTLRIDAVGLDQIAVFISHIAAFAEGLGVSPGLRRRQ